MPLHFFYINHNDNLLRYCWDHHKQSRSFMRRFPAAVSHWVRFVFKIFTSYVNEMKDFFPNFTSINQSIKFIFVKPKITNYNLSQGASQTAQMWHPLSLDPLTG